MNKNMLSQNIKTLRKERGLTQSQLAKHTGLSMSAIRSYENGLREPNSKAMAALESYFHVTGEYLRGESKDSDSPYIWQDQDVMDAVKESFPSLINKLLDSAMRGSEADRKMLFDILVELCHMSSLKNVTPEIKTASFLLIEETFTHTTRFVDFCGRLSDLSEAELTRLEKYKRSCVEDYEESLAVFQDALKKYL